MLKKILLVVVAAVAVVLAYAATLPSTFEVRRAVFIRAPAERVFTHLQDFRQWAAWSPWEKLDPALQREFSGAPAGMGAVYAWSGNEKVGSGRMEIVDVVPAERLRIRLDFIKPFEAHNTAEFVLRPGGDETHLTWTMSGPNPFMAKVMQVFVSMDEMVGHDFEHGLENLKAVAEKKGN